MITVPAWQPTSLTVQPSGMRAMTSGCNASFRQNFSRHLPRLWRDRRTGRSTFPSRASSCQKATRSPQGRCAPLPGPMHREFAPFARRRTSPSPGRVPARRPLANGVEVGGGVGVGVGVARWGPAHRWRLRYGPSWTDAVALLVPFARLDRQAPRSLVVSKSNCGCHRVWPRWQLPMANFPSPLPAVML